MVKTKVVRSCPTNFIPYTAYPVLTGTTNEALLQLVADYERALRECNADKRAFNEAAGGK